MLCWVMSNISPDLKISMYAELAWRLHGMSSKICSARSDKFFLQQAAA